MTTAAEDGGRRSRTPGWVPPALMWAGHYSLWLCIPYLVLIIAGDLTGRPSSIAWATLPALAVFWGSIIIDHGYHSARLCERCAGGTPLDPQAAVSRWRWALRLEHRNGILVPLLLANVAWSVGTGFLLVSGVHAWGLPAHHAVWAYLLQDIPTLVIITGYWVIARVHRDLYPWCPWCHWGDGGDEEMIPDPDPEDHGARYPS